MTREDNRKALKKVLGKTTSFTGTMSKIRNDLVLVTDVKIKGKSKIIADHLWLMVKHCNIQTGKNVEFCGEANSYLDSYNIRKYGVQNVHRFSIYEPQHEAASKQNKHDNYYSSRRKRR